MTDSEFIRALEACTLPPGEFTHFAHVRAGYLYLRQAGFECALARLRPAIRNYAAHLGKADLYHETITVAYLALIQQHLCEHGDAGGWTDFARGNPQLLQSGLLKQFYTETVLHSALARKVFLLPRNGVP